MTASVDAREKRSKTETPVEEEDEELEREVLFAVCCLLFSCAPHSFSPSRYANIACVIFDGLPFEFTRQISDDRRKQETDPDTPTRMRHYLSLHIFAHSLSLFLSLRCRIGAQFVAICFDLFAWSFYLFFGFVLFGAGGSRDRIGRPPRRGAHAESSSRCA